MLVKGEHVADARERGGTEVLRCVIAGGANTGKVRGELRAAIVGAPRFCFDIEIASPQPIHPTLLKGLLVHAGGR